MDINVVVNYTLCPKCIEELKVQCVVCEVWLILVIFKVFKIGLLKVAEGGYTLKLRFKFIIVIIIFFTWFHQGLVCKKNSLYLTP